MTTILNIFIGYQDFLNPDQLIQLNNHSQNLGCLQNKKLIFLLGKNTLSMVLPNNGKIFGYSLFNNSMNFIYNHTLKEEDSIPLKINHSLVYNNGNTVINRSLIYNEFKNLTKYFYKNQVISTKITTLEDSNTTNSSNSLDPIDKNEKIVIFDDIQIKVKNNMITEVNGTSFIKPIISDKDLKYYFDYGCTKNKIKTSYILSVFYHLNTKNYYKVYKESFFLLSENFREEFKILITFFDRKEFTLNENIINWFINNKIENEKLTLYEVMQNLEINKKNEIFEFSLSNTEEYYNDYNIASRMMVVNCDPKGDLSIFYESIDKYHLLNQLEALFENAIQQNE